MDCKRETCDVKHCPYGKKIYALRENGFCLKDHLKFIDNWIDEDTSFINSAMIDIKHYKKRIRRYKKLKELLLEKRRKKHDPRRK